MNKTKIEWCDYTWNPITGCLHGCSYCYARKISKRFGDDFKPTLHEDRLAQPLDVKKPSRILVSSMGDLFGNWVPDSSIRRVLRSIKLAPQHIYLLLTKNPERYSEFIFPENCWLGTTVTNQLDLWRQKALWRVTSRRFISIEPILGSVVCLKFHIIDWVIVGAQTNPEKQPKHEWVQEIINKCRKENIPIFLKNNLNWPEKIQELPFK